MSHNTTDDPKSVPKHLDFEHTPLRQDLTNSDNLTVVTFNIEGLTSNKLYLETLARRADIILLQEHWLHKYENSKLQECLDNFICFSKCFDDEISSDPSERRRGHAGVAVCINNKFEQLVELLPDGSNRIIAIKFKCETPIIFLGCYMPCRGNSHTTDDYQQVLDEISEIMMKYRDSAKFVIGGDMNASLARKSTQDKQFQTFIQEHGLMVPEQCKSVFTFYHYNGKDASQIDYFLQSDKLIDTYITFDREPLNSSTHNPILVKIPCKFHVGNQQPVSCDNPRVGLDTIDKLVYQQKVQDGIEDSKICNNDLTSVNFSNMWYLNRGSNAKC